MDFLKHMADKARGRGDDYDEETDSEIKQAAEEAHSQFHEEAQDKAQKDQKDHDVPLSHALATGAAALFMMHKYNEQREANGEEPIKGLKRFLYAIIAIATEHVAEEKIVDHHHKKQREEEAKIKAHELAAQADPKLLGEYKVQPSLA